MKTKRFILFLALAASIGTVLASVTIDGIIYNLDDATSTAEVISGGSSSGSIVIPSSVIFDAKPYNVTSIRNYAFNCNTGLTSVTIPNSVTSIGRQAFSYCTNLTFFTIPNSVTSIGDAAFAGCSGLTSIDIPNSVTSIVASAFKDCSSLTSITIPNSVTSIEGEAFNGCSSLTSIDIPNSVTSIKLSAFYGCSSLTSVTIGNSVTNIENYAFWGCSSLTSITIPNSVTSIGSYAFWGCSSLTSITIPNSVTSIGEGAFAYCSSLTSVTIPNRVKSIGNSAFSHCSSLTSVTIPNSVTSIGNYTFGDCSSLTSVTIPNSVTSIGESAFYNCTGLTSVTIPNSVTSIGERAFYNCTGLTSITIPNSVTNIENHAFFKCSGLASVTIGNSVTTIGDYAFTDCSSLTSVTIPNSVTSIGSDAFFGCRGLTSITCEAVNPPTLGSSVFYGVNKSIPLYVPAQSVNEYKAADQWKEFNIQAIPGTEVPTNYTITFVNYDGTPLQSSEVEYGSTPAYTGETPTKPADAQYTYTFAGWDAELTAVTGDATYTAQFTTTLNKYAIVFANDDGTPLQSSEVEYGAIPAYTGETPTKPADAQYTYTFIGWNPEILAVTGDATYTAVFEETLNTYTITWQNEDGNVIKTDEVGYGLMPEYTGTTPTKEATNEYTYEFAGWLPKIKSVTKDICYTTFFERNKIEPTVYTVNINGENCSLNINNQYPEGTVITLEAVADECFEFQQWSDGSKQNPRTITVTANTNLTAEFNKVRYTVTGQPSTGGKVQIRKQ